MVTGISTFLLFLVAWCQLGNINKTAKADFLFKFNRDFFNENNMLTRGIMEAIEENKPLFKSSRGRYDEYDIDDYLGYFELIQIYIDQGIMNFGDADEMFGHYVKKAWKNKEIRMYIKNLRRTTGDISYYDKFEKLAKKLLSQSGSEHIYYE